MGRPQTKSELFSAARDEFDRLWSVAETVRDEDRGFSWAETPALNEVIYQRHKTFAVDSAAPGGTALRKEPT